MTLSRRVVPGKAGKIQTPWALFEIVNSVLKDAAVVVTPVGREERLKKAGRRPKSASSQ